MAKTTIGAAYIRLALSAKGLKAGTKEAKKELVALRKSVRKVRRDFKRMGKRAKTLGTALAGLGASLGFVIKKTVDFGGELAESAQLLGVNAQALAEMRLAANLAGVETQKLQDVMEKAMVRAGRALETGKGQFQLFADAAGISVDQLQGNTSTAFEVVLETLASVEDPLRRAGLANTLFASINAAATLKLVDAWGAGREAFKRFGIEISDLGKIERIGDQFTILETVLRYKVLQALIDNQDAILDLARFAVENVPKVLDAFADIVEWAETNSTIVKWSSGGGLLGYIIGGRFGMAVFSAAGAGLAWINGEIEKLGLPGPLSDLAEFGAPENAARSSRPKRREASIDGTRTESSAAGGGGAPLKGMAEQFRDATSMAESFGESLQNNVVSGLADVATGMGALAQDTTMALLSGESVKLGEALKGIGKEFISSIVGGLVKFGAQLAINFALSKVFQAKTVAAGSTAAAALAAANAPAATLATIASFGGAAAAAPAAVAAALGSTQAIATGFAATASAASLAGAARTGGFPSDFQRSPGYRDSVPALIAPGEFVLPETAVAQLGRGNLRELQRGNLPAGGGGVVNVGGISLVLQGGIHSREDAGRAVDMIDEELKGRFGQGLLPAQPSPA